MSSPGETFPARPGLYGVVNSSRLHPLELAIQRALQAPVPLQRRQTATSKRKTKPMSNSERGIKFRERQREREAALSRDTERLRDEIQRLQALRDLYEAKSLASQYCTADAPMKFIMEYFQQFRIGLHVPNAPASVLSSKTQRQFLDAWIEPHTKFGGKPAAEMILSVWEHYSRFHTSVKLELESANLITGENWSSVAVCGILHLRYSRRTIQHVFPSAIGDEELIQKLIGRQLHVHYRAQMHFNASGRLEGYEITPDFVGALMEVLGSIRDCERMLGRALIKGHVLGEKSEQVAQNVEPVQIRSNSEATKLPTEETQAPRSHLRSMDLEYILS